MTTSPGRTDVPPRATRERSGSKESGTESAADTPRGAEATDDTSAGTHTDDEERKRQSDGNRGPDEMPGFGQGA